MGITYAKSILDEKVIKIFPNPCSNKLQVNFKYDLDIPVRIEVLNMKGEVVMEQTLRNVTKNETIDLNTSGLQAGNYLVVVRNDYEIFSRKNFIRNP
jgi:hypothetical protein